MQTTFGSDDKLSTICNYISHGERRSQSFHRYSPCWIGRKWFTNERQTVAHSISSKYDARRRDRLRQKSFLSQDGLGCGANLAIISCRGGEKVTNNSAGERGGALANQSNDKDPKQVKVVHVWAFRSGLGGGRSHRFVDNLILLCDQLKRF